MTNRILSSSIVESNTSVISKFIKYYWINIIIFVSIICIFSLNLVSVIIETRDHFDISKLVTLLEKEKSTLATSILPTIQDIDERQKISLISNTMILVIDFVLFVFLCTLILKRNFLTNKRTNGLNGSTGIEPDENDRLIPPNNNHIGSTGNDNNMNNKGGTASNSFFSLTQNYNHNNHNLFDKGTVYCESSINEPWNQITIEKISSDQDTPVMEKIRNTYYRYGITAGKIIYERSLFFLNREEKGEICRLFSIIEPQ